jgi:hypothetical protein
MEELDRLGWAAGISFQSYGVRIGVRANKAEGLDALVRCFPPGWKPSSSPFVDCLYSVIVGSDGARRGLRHFHQLYADSTRIVRSLDLAEVISILESDLDLLVASNARRRVFVHAGVVAWNGQAVLIPGRSLSGKTTLVAELVRAGADYYSDDYAVLDPQGHVSPFARSLSIREPSGSVRTSVPVQELGGRMGKRSLPVGLIVVSEYRSGGRWRPRPLSPGRALLALLDNTVPARISPGLVLPTLRHVVSRASALKSSRGEAEEVVEALIARLHR